VFSLQNLFSSSSQCRHLQILFSTIEHPLFLIEIFLCSEIETFLDRTMKKQQLWRSVTDLENGGTFRIPSRFYQFSSQNKIISSQWNWKHCVIWICFLFHFILLKIFIAFTHQKSFRSIFAISEIVVPIDLSGYQSFCHRNYISWSRISRSNFILFIKNPNKTWRTPSSILKTHHKYHQTIHNPLKSGKSENFYQPSVRFSKCRFQISRFHQNN
jgi:hypothetical protein